MSRLPLVLLPALLMVACSGESDPQDELSASDRTKNGHEQSLEHTTDAEDRDEEEQPGDLQEYLWNTHDMVEDKQYSAALERYVWFHEHALEHNPHMSGVRLSFALGGWRELADVYPPAMEALVETRDRAAAQVRNGAGSWDGFHDVQSLNRYLDDESLTVELFGHLHETEPKLAQRVWNVAKSDLIAAGRYELAKHYIGNPMHSLAAIRRSYERNQTRYGDANGEDQLFREYNENKFVEETLELMQVFTALEKHDLVEQIGNEALKTFRDPRIEYAMER